MGNMFVSKLLKNDGSGAVIENPTVFRAELNKDYLCVEFICTDDNPKSTMTGHNNPIYDQEVVEIFISPDGIHDRYFEFEVNHLSASFSAWIDHTETENIINFVEPCPADFKVTKTPFGWNAEILVPIKILGDNFDINKATFNAYRIKRDENNNFILTALFPTLADNFHLPEKFGKLSIVNGGEF